MPLTPAEATSLNASLAADVAKFTQTAPPAARTLYFGYFGYATPEAAQTGDHCNLVFLPSWGAMPTNWPVIASRAVDWLNEAKAAGIQNAVLTVDYLIFSGATLVPNAAANLTALLTQLQTAGVLQMVKAFYPCDEPDLNGFSDATLVAAVALIKKVAAQFAVLADVQCWVIYGVNGTPGMSAYDAVGRDNYGAGAGALTWYNSVPAGKGLILIPGGAQPWDTDPSAFVAYALTNAATICLLPFLWVDYAGGKGISDNGMAPAYKTAGQRILAQK